jgi:hypothetical protein
METRRKRTYQAVNIGAVVLTLTVNWLANSLPLFGRTTGEVSGNYPNLFTPAGFTFSIWGFIYVLLILFTVYQARDLFRDRPVAMDFLRRIGFWFAIASFGNISWIFAFHANMILLSLVPILVLFFGLLISYRRLDVGKSPVSLTEVFMVRLPFSVYLGWVSIAVIANITAALVSLGWKGEPLPQAFWAVLMIGAGTILGLMMLFSRGDLFYALVVMWAFTGILVKRSQVGDAPSVVTAAASGIAVLVISCAWFIPKKGLYRRKRTLFHGNTSGAAVRFQDVR